MAVQAAEAQLRPGRLSPPLRAVLPGPVERLPFALSAARDQPVPQPGARLCLRKRAHPPSPGAPPRVLRSTNGGGPRGLAPPLSPARGRPGAAVWRSACPGAWGQGAEGGGGRGRGVRAVSGRRSGPGRLTSAQALTRTPPRPQVTRQDPAAGWPGTPTARSRSGGSLRATASAPSSAAENPSPAPPRAPGLPAPSQRLPPQVAGPAGPRRVTHGPRTCHQEGPRSHLGLSAPEWKSARHAGLGTYYTECSRAAPLSSLLPTLNQGRSQSLLLRIVTGSTTHSSLPCPKHVFWRIVISLP